MFGLFYSIVLALFQGNWVLYDTTVALENLQAGVTLVWNNIATLLRNIGLKIPDNFTLSDAESFIGILDQNVSDYAEMLGLFLPRLIASIIAMVVTVGIILVTIKAIRSIFRVFLCGRLK